MKLHCLSELVFNKSLKPNYNNSRFYIRLKVLLGFLLFASCVKNNNSTFFPDDCELNNNLLRSGNS